MFRTVLLTALMCAFFCVNAAAEKPEIISQIKLKPLTKQQYLQIREWGLDLKQQKDDVIEVFATPGDLARLRQIGADWDVIHGNLQDFYVLRSTAADFGGFRTFDEIEIYLDVLSSTYPGIMTPKFSIGTSIEGRQLWAVKVSDNPGVDEDEPELLYIALVHAREPAASAALVYFMEHLLSNYGTDPEITDIVNNRELFFVPVQNPDGYVYNEETYPEGGGMWRKNRRDNLDGSFGVDLNRNYGYAWGFDDLGSSPYTYSTLFRGTAPFSEPETDYVRAFVESRDITIIHNFHCYSNLELWAPSYDRFYGSEEDFYSNLGDTMTQYNGYDPGIGWTLYPTNGDADDWAWCDSISKPRIISLTVEIGSAEDGFWPNPSRIPTLCEENVFPNLYLAKIADDPFIIAPPKTPVISSPETSMGDYTVSWTLDDPDNPAAMYRLMEYTGKAQYTDDAESDYGYWNTHNMVLSSARSYSGSTSWHTTNYSRDHHWLNSAVPYEVKASDVLAFWAWWEIEEHWDYFYAQISTDGGYTYENLACGFTTNDDPNNINLGNGITGTSGGWTRLEFDLSAYEGQQVLFRLSYFTDDYYVYEGVYIDDVENVEAFAGAVEISSSIPDPYYDFTSKPDGEYWYRVSGIDAQGQEGRQSPYTCTEVSTIACCVVNGDTNHDGSLNPLDAAYITNWMWRGGPGLPCEEEGDVNGDGDVNPLDAVYLVNYLWKGGPAPVDCHPLSP